MLVLALAGGALGPAAARAQPAPITDSDWSLDLYDAAVLGSVRIVGMGGAQVALAQGSAGTLSNPAAPAARGATSSRWWDWDVHLDALSAVVSNDFDNNGRLDDGRVDRHVTAGGALMFHDWGVAITIETAQTRVETTSGALDAGAGLGKLAVARAPGDETWAYGAALRVGSFTLDGDRGQLFAVTGLGLEGGVLYRPFREDLRLGAALALPLSGDEVATAEGCQLDDCQGRILPARVAAPWQLEVGGAWRFAPTRWNQWVAGKFRDERSLTLAADLVVTGATRDAMGLEAFGRGEWQPSGRRVTVGARAGAEWEPRPGRVRVRAGTYWEPSRYAGVSGRPHLTAGVELGFFTFRIGKTRKYRLRVGATGDFAPRFGNAGLSFGFWG